MSYIGKEPVIGNFSVADAITTSSTATYALTVGSVAFTPESVNHCIVSLNGVVQAPTNAFTISGTNIVFASALTSSDVIDFIYFLGHVNDIGTPSDSTVTLAKLTATGTASSSTYLRGDNTWAAAGVSGISSSSSSTAISIDANGHVTMPLTSAFNAVSAANQTVSTSDDTTVVLGTEVFDQNADFASNTFTAPVTGRYQLNGQVVATGIDDEYLYFRIVTSNRTYGGVHQVPSTRGAEYEIISTSCLADMDAGDTAFLQVNSESDTSFELRDAESEFSGYLAC